MTTASVLRPSAHLSARPRWRRHRAEDVAAATPAEIEFTWENRRPQTAGFARWAAAVGERIDRYGLADSSRDVNNLIDVARRFRVAPVLVDVLGDTNLPEPVRIRAFALVVTALVGS